MAKPEEAVLIHLLVFSPLHGEEMIGETIIDYLRTLVRTPESAKSPAHGRERGPS